MDKSFVWRELQKLQAMAEIEKKLKAETQVRLEAEKIAAAKAREFNQFILDLYKRAEDQCEKIISNLKKVSETDLEYADVCCNLGSDYKDKGECSFAELQAELEEKSRSYAKASAETEKKLQAQTQVMAEIEEKLKAETRARLKAEKIAAAEAKVRAECEANVEVERKVRTKYEKKAKSYARARVTIRNGSGYELVELDRKPKTGCYATCDREIEH